MRARGARVLSWLWRSRGWAVAAVGAVLAVQLAGSVAAEIGPFDTTVAARPAFGGQTTVRLGPLGTIGLDTHDTPVSLDLQVDELRVNEAEAIAGDPARLGAIEDDIAGDTRRALLRLALRVLVAALAGGVVGALAVSFAWRSVLRGLGSGLVLVTVLGGTTAATFDAAAIAEPRYTGLMTIAPRAVGDVEAIVDRFGEYRAQLTDLVTNVVDLYRAAERLPTSGPGSGAIRVLHVSDVHLNPQAFDLIRLLVDQFDVAAVVDSGDITDWGTQPEARLLAAIGEVGVPYVWVRGNHDSRRTQRAVARNRNAVVLDGDAVDVAGLRFWGVGDPRYTPDKSGDVGKDVERADIEAFAERVPGLLAPSQPVDVVVVHDARATTRLGDDVPLVLAGHTHRAAEARRGATTILVEGTTGGGGLRGLQKETPQPLTCSILYFDPVSKRLVAYDRVTVRGLGETGATLERHVVRPGGPSPSPTSTFSPSLSPTPS